MPLFCWLLNLRSLHNAWFFHDESNFLIDRLSSSLEQSRINLGPSSFMSAKGLAKQVFKLSFVAASSPSHCQVPAQICDPCQLVVVPVVQTAPMITGAPSVASCMATTAASSAVFDGDEVVQNVTVQKSINKELSYAGRVQRR